MEQLKVTKTYTVVTADRWCQAAVPSGYPDMDDSGFCGKRAVYCFNIETITIHNRRVVNAIGFCIDHLPRKYRMWFKIPLTSVSVWVASEAGPSQAQLMRHGG